MTELGPEARALADRMYEPRGYIHEWHLYLAQRRPEVLDHWEQLTRTANRTSALPPRYREQLRPFGALAAQLAAWERDR